MVIIIWVLCKAKIYGLLSHEDIFSVMCKIIGLQILNVHHSIQPDLSFQLWKNLASRKACVLYSRQCLGNVFLGPSLPWYQNEKYWSLKMAFKVAFMREKRLHKTWSFFIFQLLAGCWSKCPKITNPAEKAKKTCRKRRRSILGD